MTIRKQKPKAAVEATSTHFDNLEKVVVEEGNQKLTNNQDPETLIDPAEDEGGSTHTSVTAGSTMVDDESPDDVDGGAEGAAEGEQNISEICNDVDPAAGYLTEHGTEATANDGGDFGEDQDPDEVDDTEIDASDVDLTNSGQQSLLEADEEDWNADGGDGEDEDDDIEDDTEVEEDLGDDEEAEEEDEGEVEASEGEAMDLVDVDGMEDSGDGAVFASWGSRLIVIKANRIVATMSKKTAVTAGHEDMYLSDQFEQVVASELSKQGLRKGLKAMGFQMAKVNVATSAVVNARVTKQVVASTAAVRRVAASKEKAFADSLAIAAVGLNRGRWKDVTNPLKAALQEELQAAGVRNSARLVHNVFAAHGIDYAKAICAMATKLASMPQESRDMLTASLDMTTDNDDDDLYGVENGELGEAEEMTGEEEFDDGFEELIEHPNAVNSTLATAGFRTQTKAALLHKATQYSVSASEVLAGKKPLPF